jgi:hypothetical protein
MRSKYSPAQVTVPSCRPAKVIHFCVIHVRRTDATSAGNSLFDCIILLGGVNILMSRVTILVASVTIVLAIVNILLTNINILQASVTILLTSVNILLAIFNTY